MKEGKAMYRKCTSFVIVVSLVLSCSPKNPIVGGEDDSSVEVQVVFQQSFSRLAPLGKRVTITSVVVTVTGPDMSPITKELTIDMENNTASGSVEVPKGDSRTFLIEGTDENGVVQFSGSTTQNIRKKNEAVTINVTWIPPDPVEVTISNVTTTTAHISWVATDAPDFQFYRVLFSSNPQLDASVDRFGDDIYDRNSTMVTLSELSENTTYYVAVLVVDTELWFSGALEYGSQNSIVEKFTTAREVLVSYDDGNFEQFLYSTDVGDRAVMRFTPPAYPCYIKTIWLYLRDTSGQDGNYRLVIMDSNHGDLFRTDPLETSPGEDWVGWNPLWSNRDDGTITGGDFYAGIEWVKGIGWPEIGRDISSTQRRGEYYSTSSGNWYIIDDLVDTQGNQLSGHFGVRATVEVVGEGGTVLALTPDNVWTPGISPRQIKEASASPDGTESIRQTDGFSAHDRHTATFPKIRTER